PSIAVAENTGCLAWNTSSGLPETELALARLEAMVERRTDWAFIAEPATSKIGRLLMGGLLSRRSLAGDRGQHSAHLRFDERHRGAVFEDRLGEDRVLAVAVDGVAVEAGLCGRAGIAGGLGGAGDRVAGFGRGPQRGRQGAVEVQVLGLVAGRVGVGDVGGEQLQALLAQGKRGAVDAKEIGHGPSVGRITPMEAGKRRARRAVERRRRAQPRAVTRAATR